MSEPDRIMEPCNLTVRLGAYLDDELSVEDRARIETHLLVCPACAAELADLRHESEALRAMPLPAMSPMVSARLHAAIDRSIALAGEQGLMIFTRRLAMVAACVVIGGSVWLSASAEKSKPKAAPPWAGVTVSAESESVSRDITSPAAQWYLADASGSDRFGD